MSNTGEVIFAILESPMLNGVPAKANICSAQYRTNQELSWFVLFFCFNRSYIRIYPLFTSSSEPGSDATNLRIRGSNTFNDNSVLVVIDGVPDRSLERIGPNTIESITVLKDASAAIYGSRVANGVIPVTTKRGKTGKPELTFNGNYGYNQPTKLPKMADAPLYATALNEIAYYNNPSGGLNQTYTPDQIQKFKDGSDPLRYPNTIGSKRS